MGEASDAACKVLDQTGQSSVVYEAVARYIVEIAKSGERDPQQLRDSAPTAVGRKRFIPLPPRNQPSQCQLDHVERRRVVAIARSPFAESASFLFRFFFCSINHNHAKPRAKITITIKTAYSIIGAALN
jgi:hypothetical protein